MSLDSLAQARIRALEIPDPEPEGVAALQPTGYNHGHEADAASLIHHIPGRDLGSHLNSNFGHSVGAPARVAVAHEPCTRERRFRYSLFP